LKCYKK